MSNSVLLILTNSLGTKVNAANVGIGVKNQDGTINYSGTVVGSLQTIHSVVDFSSMGASWTAAGTATGRIMPGVGTVLGVWAGGESIIKIDDALKNGKPIDQSDIASVIGNAAAVLGGGLLFFGATASSPAIIIGLSVVAVGAGLYQMVASATGWTVGGQQVNLTAEQVKQANVATAEVFYSNEGRTAIAASGLPSTAVIKVDSIVISRATVSSGPMAGRSLVTATDTQSGEVSYQLQPAAGSGTGPQGNRATNGNVSFYVDGAIYVFNGGTYVGVFNTAGTSGTLAGASGAQYSYDFTTGQIRSISSAIGGVSVAGLTVTQTSANGTSWSAPVYAFADVAAATAADYAAWNGLGTGTLDGSVFQDLVNASSQYLTNSGSSVTLPNAGTSNPNPIGAFYDSQSASYDTAASIARYTPVLVDANQRAVTATQLTALDTNKDGQLSLAESASLRFWRDLDEQGQAGAGEVGGVDRVITAAEYGLYTQANGLIGAGAAAAPVQTQQSPQPARPTAPSVGQPGRPGGAPGVLLWLEQVSNDPLYRRAA